MAGKWTVLRYSRNQVKKAGKTLRDHADSVMTVTEDEVVHANTVLENWRSAHSYALNAAQMGLRSRIRTACDIDKPEVAQRSKERPSIIAKLQRGAPRMQLSTMQDIAGCRGVVPTIEDVYAVASRYHQSDLKVVGEDDYIEEPAESGYRGLHLVVAYQDRPTKQDRLVEVQLRTEIQHEWAVAVENTGRRNRIALKQGEGPADLVGYYRMASIALEQRELDGHVTAPVRKELERARERAQQALRKMKRK